jgi:NDP-sugar pyrophosphorylase family protein
MKSALLLAAGKATRLQSIRDQYAKACVPIADTTPLKFMLQQLALAGVQEVWINLHWKAEQVREQALQAAADGMEIRFIEETHLLGTGGTLLECYRRRGLLPDLVVNAKVFCDVNFDILLQHAPGTLVLHPGSALSEFGGLHFDPQMNITGLMPKSIAKPATNAAVYTGIARPAAEWLPYLQQAHKDLSLPEGEQSPAPILCMLRHGMLPALADGIACRAWLHPGYWHEISTPERVKLAVRLRREGYDSHHVER